MTDTHEAPEPAPFRLGDAVIADGKPGSISKIVELQDGSLAIRVQHDNGDHEFYGTSFVEHAEADDDETVS